MRKGRRQRGTNFNLRTWEDWQDIVLWNWYQLGSESPSVCFGQACLCALLWSICLLGTLEKASSFGVQLRTWHNDKYVRLSEEFEFSGIHLAVILCTWCSAAEWILCSPCLPAPFYAGNNWYLRNKCHVVPVTPCTGSSVIKYSGKWKMNERERDMPYRNWFSKSAEL